MVDGSADVGAPNNTFLFGAERYRPYRVATAEGSVCVRVGGGIVMASSAYLRLQADLCRRLSMVTSDNILRVRYAGQAQQLAAQAEQLELGSHFSLAPETQPEADNDDDPSSR
jgi:hypothetical protein